MATASQSSPYSMRTHSRASEPLRKQTRFMKSPVGARNTCDDCPAGSVVSANTVSLVPSDTATTRSWMMPVPIRLDGLSPVHGTIAAAR